MAHSHFNSNGEVMGKYIEITRVPALLQSQEEEMNAALTALNSRLQTTGESTP
ncbi:MAG TPA: hypothetical protein EYP90_08415 [Chromatiaceae bacterium]|nr:hypothetical protein [Chromatiaceae bacterium]